MIKSENKIEQWDKLFNRLPTPILEIANYKNCRIFIKRDDLNHTVVQGNKLRKLKYNLLKAIKSNYDTVLTFGGAYSNHILATAQASSECQIHSIGIIRGDELALKNSKWSQTLIQAQNVGMKLRFVNRKQYRLKHQSEDAISIIKNQSRLPFVIPEGGSNQLAIAGVSEIINELKLQIKQPDYIFSACGTGGTLAGLIDGVFNSNWKTKICGIPVLNAMDSINENIEVLSEHSNQVNWQLYDNYHFGGYAKHTDELVDFSKMFSKNNNIPLDKIYTSKAFYAVFDLINKGAIKPKTSVLILHTGGLQGGEF